MRKIVILFFLLICLNIFPADNTEYGFLQLNVIYDHYNHKVEIFRYSDGDHIKATLYRVKGKLRLIPGIYRILYQKENQTAFEEFEIVKNETTFIDLKFIPDDDFNENYKGSITITANPDEEGDILIDNRKIGKAKEKIQIPPGIHKVFFRNNNNVSAKEVVVFPDDEINLTLPLVTKKDLNKYLFQKHYYYESAAFTGRFFYLLGVILPPTNLLFMSFYANPMVLAGFLVFPYVMVPVVTTSIACSIVGWVLFGYQGYKYFIDPDGKDNLSYFVGSTVCLGVSYLINLVIGIIGFTVMGGFYIDRYDLKSKYRYIKELMLEINQEEINLSYGVKF